MNQRPPIETFKVSPKIPARAKITARKPKVNRELTRLSEIYLDAISRPHSLEHVSEKRLERRFPDCPITKILLSPTPIRQLSPTEKSRRKRASHSWRFDNATNFGHNRRARKGVCVLGEPHYQFTIEVPPMRHTRSPRVCLVVGELRATSLSLPKGG